MRCIILSALLGILAGSQTASAETPGYVGRWAEKRASCSDRLSDAMPIEIKKRRLQGYDSTCTFQRVEGVNPWTVDSVCEGEGQTFSQRWRYTRKGDSLIAESLLGPKLTVNYVLCPGA